MIFINFDPMKLKWTMSLNQNLDGSDSLVNCRLLELKEYKYKNKYIFSPNFVVKNNWNEKFDFHCICKKSTKQICNNFLF